uniref:PDZ domain-containing protein n=1 Tax=Guillardia theta TaxID=55529 RepID=A0A7S4UNC9_GUITH|mmetsp:Transcript_49049/g.154009  ORF Transcript_49049/g.154009 Transcript_49049/m.154009 type:complete len:589 (-) Transcript_49049:167-1933(-)
MLPALYVRKTILCVLLAIYWVGGSNGCNVPHTCSLGCAMQAHHGNIRLRGGASIDGSCVVDVTKNAGIGIGLGRDKLGNHMVKKLKDGWPARLSGLVFENDIILEVDERPVGPLSTTALTQELRGPDGSEVKLLLQRGPEGSLHDVSLVRVAQGEPVAKESEASLLSSTIAASSSILNAASSSLLGAISLKSGQSKSSAASDVGIGVGFTLDESANFVVTKLVPGGPAAESGQLQVGDILLSCNGLSLIDMSMKDLVSHIKGREGTTVTLELQTEEGELKTAVITRRPLKGVHTEPEQKKSSSLFSALGDIGGLASSSISSLSATAGDASAKLSSSLSSLTNLMGSVSFTKSTPAQAAAARSPPAAAAAAAYKGEGVGVGIGIKKNQHGDFMVTEVYEGGAAAEDGQIAVGDILQKLDDTPVSGMRSSALKDLIFGPPNTRAVLSMCRWRSVPGKPEGEWKTFTVTLTRRASKVAKKSKAPVPASAAAPPGAAGAAPSRPSKQDAAVASAPSDAPQRTSKPVKSHTGEKKVGSSKTTKKSSAGVSASRPAKAGAQPAKAAAEEAVGSPDDTTKSRREEEVAGKEEEIL